MEITQEEIDSLYLKTKKNAEDYFFDPSDIQFFPVERLQDFQCLVEYHAIPPEINGARHGTGAGTDVASHRQCLESSQYDRIV